MVFLVAFLVSLALLQADSPTSAATSLVFRGYPHAATGMASLQVEGVAPGDFLRVTNIGSSGLDGVEIATAGAAPESVAIEFDIQDVQAWVLTHEIGHALGASHVTAEKDAMSNPPVGWGGNFAAEGFSTYKVRIYMQSTIVDSIPFILIDDRRLKTFETSGTMVHKFVGLFSELAYRPAAPIVIVDGHGERGPWTGDRIVFSGDSPAPKPRTRTISAGIQSIAIRAAGLPEFLILNEDPAGTATDVVGPGLQPAVLRVLPSPFRARTWVELSLLRESHVVVSAYDVTGRRVDTLHRGTMAPGLHALPWDARGVDGRRVAPGVYVIRLQSPTATSAARVVVLPH